MTRRKSQFDDDFDPTDDWYNDKAEKRRHKEYLRRGGCDDGPKWSKPKKTRRYRKKSKGQLIIRRI